MMASSTNALSSCDGLNCNSHRNMKPLTAMIDSVAAGNRRDGILSRIGSTAGFLTVRYPKLKRNRRHTRLPHQNLGQPALLRVSSGPVNEHGRHQFIDRTAQGQARRV